MGDEGKLCLPVRGVWRGGVVADAWGSKDLGVTKGLRIPAVIPLRVVIVLQRLKAVERAIAIHPCQLILLRASWSSGKRSCLSFHINFSFISCRMKSGGAQTFALGSKCSAAQFDYFNSISNSSLTT